MSWLARSPGRAFAVIFLLAFALRAAQLPFTPIELVLDRPSEMHRLATTLAETGRFADPYAAPTGPTAHLPPAHAFMLSLLYRALGDTRAAGYARCLILIASFSTMYALLPWFARRFGLPAEAGVAGGLLGASTLPQRWPAEVALGWNEPYASIALGLLMLVFLRRWSGAGASVAGSVAFGAAWGAAFHLQPALLTVFAGAVAFEVWRERSRRAWRLAGALALGAAVACVPWAWRNYATFHDVFFVRSNFGLELRVANHEGAIADLEVMAARGPLHHPAETVEEASALRSLGEAEYMRRARREALAWIRAHPARFAWLTFQRVLFFWFGSPYEPWQTAGVLVVTLLALAGARRTLPALTVPQRAALLVPLATYPLVYYVVAFMVRYRVPINGILLMFAGAAVSGWIAARRRTQIRPAP